MKLSELSRKLGLRLVGDGDIDIVAPASLKNANANNISFFHNKRYRNQLLDTNAGAVILKEKDFFSGAQFSALISENPLDDFRKCVEIFFPKVDRKAEISERASIHPDARIGKSVRIEDFVVVGKNSRIGDGTLLGAGTVVGEDVIIGKNCKIYPRVVIYDGVQLGNNVIVHSGAVLGSDGFGYSRTDDGVFHKIPQIGGLVIEDDVEIGANTTIDRGALENTVIGKGTKIDNLVQIGHNVIVGENCAFAGQAGIAGSCIVGNRVLLGGQAGLAGHLTLGDDVVVYAQSGVDKSFEQGIVLLGSPARPAKITMKQLAALARLPDIIKNMKK